MADEIDPLEVLVKSHVERMAEITNAGITKSQALCDETMLAIKAKAGMRSSLLDKALEALGVVANTEVKDQP